MLSTTFDGWIFYWGDKMGFKQSWIIFILVEMLKKNLLLFYENNFKNVELNFLKLFKYSIVDY
jgi:hypothetical protein